MLKNPPVTPVDSFFQVFSPKQKELFKKKLEGLTLYKTEQEYYFSALVTSKLPSKKPKATSFSRLTFASYSVSK